LPWAKSTTKEQLAEEGSLPQGTAAISLSEEACTGESYPARPPCTSRSLSDPNSDDDDDDDEEDDDADSSEPLLPLPLLPLPLLLLLLLLLP
jgi:hypothetical protein